VPAIKDGLGDGEFGVALLGLEAGAVLGLQLGGLVVPRTGSRRALVASLAAFSCALPLPALAPSLLVLAASLFVFAVVNSVVDVAMNAQGLAVGRLVGRPVLSGLHAMHSLGGVLGAGMGALAARFGYAPPPHFLACASVAVVAALAAWPLLLPSRVDAAEQPSSEEGARASALRRWFGGWSVPVALLGALAFCFTLAEGAGLNWSAVYVTSSSRGTEALGAVGLGVFLGAVTLGRLAGDRLVSRFGAVWVFRAGAVAAGAGFGGALLLANAGLPFADDAAEAFDEAVASTRLRALAGEAGRIELLPAEADGLDHAIGRLVLIVFAAQENGSWPRLKACAECHWALYDRTKNLSAAWCGPQCGTRVRARRHRRRRREDSS